LSTIPEFSYFATAPRGLADLLARELIAAGATQVSERAAGVQFGGSLEIGYRACLWSRVASRVLLQLFEVEAADADTFYQRARGFEWEAHIDPALTLACQFTGVHPTIVNTHFGALRLKDAVCDRLREVSGKRPDVALARPAVSLQVHAEGTRLIVYLDLAGEGLHRRGYRLEAAAAPLRENLAAGILLRARWDEAARRGAEFFDPMCGSGTLVIEAALIAAHQAPALHRDYFGFLGWRGHDAQLWQRLRDEARGAIAPEVASLIHGSDIDAQALTQAHANAARAQVAQWVRFERSALADARPQGSGAGLICTNPPYGERLAQSDEALALHQELGRVLRQHFQQWDAAILSALPDASRALRLRTYRVHRLWNGPIACRLLRIDLAAPGAEDVRARTRATSPAALSPGAQMFANRLRKNLQRLGKQAGRAGVSCYRLYDADMPEYAFAIDHYVDAASATRHLCVQEYAPPATVDAQAARQRRHEALSALPGALEVDPERIHLRTRERRRGGTQLAGTFEQREAQRFTVTEAGLSFRVDLEAHFDTGLFLDQRPTRALLRDRARAARFLNLFCYTGTATVYAAAGGADSSVSVDLSNSYLDWAAENFALNRLDPSRHELVRADCRAWLEAAAHAQAHRRIDERATRFDLIFLDPPTFSNSKRMQGVLDTQRDHPALIEACMQLLTEAGLLLFSTNAQRFRLEPSVLARWRVRDLSRQTLPFDFARHPDIHHCFEIRRA
jgi:23S rRNA (guanine2445-N2)-methyltransferase / 23S rRNA (guanine2069-N7)-methyltransferase